MSAYGRRKELIGILIRRRTETVTNLANELGVSERTIRRDIEKLSVTEPIYTKTGRYGGGVYIMDGFTRCKRPSVNDEEAEVIRKLCLATDISDRLMLSDSELRVLERITGRISEQARQ